MTANRRIALNVVATYGRSLYAISVGKMSRDRDVGLRRYIHQTESCLRMKYLVELYM